MLYPFLYNRKTSRNITFSEVKFINGNKQIRIYADELPNDQYDDISELEFYLPKGNITKQIGFTNADVKEIQDLVFRNAEIIWELAYSYQDFNKNSNNH